MRVGVTQAGDFIFQMEERALLELTKSRVGASGDFVQDMLAG